MFQCSLQCFCLFVFFGGTGKFPFTGLAFHSLCKGCGFSCNVGEFNLVCELWLLEMSGISTKPKWKLLKSSKYSLIALCKYRE